MATQAAKIQKAAPAPARPAAARTDTVRAKAPDRRPATPVPRPAPPLATMHVTLPSDPAEHAARAAAQGQALPVSANSSARAHPVSDDIGGQIRARLGRGTTLPPEVAGVMAQRLQGDFSAVRLHTGPDAARLATRLHARAFTYGRDVFFGQDQFQPQSITGQALIAHELTHTMQPREVIQRQESSTSVLAGAANLVSSAWNDITEFSDSVGWKLVRQFAPSLEPVIRSGPDGLSGWLKDRAGAAVEGMVNTVTAPVHAVSGAGAQLVAQFRPLATGVQEAAAKIERNDCSPLREAAAKIEDIATTLVTPIVEKLQPVLATVKSVASTLWTKIGVPVVDFIKEYAAEKWAEIQAVWSAAKAIAGVIWDQTAAARALVGQAWTWLKNKLGIGEGAEGQDGLLQWAQRKLDAAWTWLKNLLAPFSRQLTTIGTAVGAVLIAISPAGPVLAVGAAVAGAVKGLQWIAANWGKGNIVVQSRVYLEKTLIPPLLAAASQLSASVGKMAASLSGTLHSLATGIASAAQALGGDILAVVAAPVQWVADQITELADWAQSELAQLSRGLTGALGGLQSFMQNMLDFLGKVGGVVLDIYALPVLLGGKIWNWVPACLRDPIVDFLGPIILQQIELFSELGKDNVAWQKTKAEIGNLIKLIFKDHDLIGAVKAGFQLVLRVFNLPPDLLTTVWNKAVASWDTISKKPLDFIKNTVRSLSRGFGLLLAHIGPHLQFGLEGWLFGELAEKNIKPPASWKSPKDIFYFALDVLGLSVNHVFDLLKQRFPPEKVEALKKWYGRIASVGAWIDKTIDVNKTPAENTKGIVDQAKDFGTGILTDLATWVTVKVSEELALLAASAAASAGLSEVLDIARRIYKALLTAKRWARRLVDMANDTLDNVLDIAAGAVEKVGVKFEGILHKAMPVVIGFLADQVGLGDVGGALRTAVDKLRARVDAALLWLIDKVKAALATVIGTIKAGAAAVFDWWHDKRQMKLGDGHMHTLKFVRSGDLVSLNLASANEKPVREHLRNAIQGNALNAGQKKKAQDADAYFVKHIEPVTRKPISPTSAKELEALISALPDSLNTLSDMLAAIGNAGAVSLPAKADWDPKGPKRSYVEKLSNRTSLKGEAARTNPAGWDVITGHGLTQRNGYWVRMHMITAGVGGQDVPGNLVPAPAAVNTGGTVRGFELKVESILYDDESSKKVRANPSMFAGLQARNPVIWIETRTTSFWSPPMNTATGKPLYDRDTFAHFISFVAGIHHPGDGNWPKDPAPLVQAEVEVPEPPLGDDYVPSLNEIGERQIVDQVHISAHYAREIASLRGGTPGTEPFVSARDFTTRMRKGRSLDPMEHADYIDMENTVIKAISQGKLKWRN